MAESDGAAEPVEEGGVVSGCLHVDDRSRFLSLGGSGDLVDDPGSVDAAALLCLKIIAAPNELTRTRMPFLAGGSVDVEDKALDGVELEDDSGMAMVRTGRP